MTFKDSRISHDISWYLIIFGHWEVCALHCSTTSKQQAVIPNQKLSTNLIQVLSQREAASIAALDHANARLKQDGLDGHATWWGVKGSLVGLGAHLKPKTISVATCSRVCHSWSITWSDPICMTWLACSTVAHLMAQGVAKNPNLLPQDHNFHVRYTDIRSSKRQKYNLYQFTNDRFVCQSAHVQTCCWWFCYILLPGELPYPKKQKIDNVYFQGWIVLCWLPSVGH